MITLTLLGKSFIKTPCFFSSTSVMLYSVAKYFNNVTIEKDLSGKDRFLFIRK